MPKFHSREKISGNKIDKLTEDKIVSPLECIERSLNKFVDKERNSYKRNFAFYGPKFLGKKMSNAENISSNCTDGRDSNINKQSRSRQSSTRLKEDTRISSVNNTNFNFDRSKCREDNGILNDSMTHCELEHSLNESDRLSKASSGGLNNDSTIDTEVLSHFTPEADPRLHHSMKNGNSSTDGLNTSLCSPVFSVKSDCSIKNSVKNVGISNHTLSSVHSVKSQDDALVDDDIFGGEAGLDIEQDIHNLKSDKIDAKINREKKVLENCLLLDAKERNKLYKKYRYLYHRAKKKFFDEPCNLKEDSKKTVKYKEFNFRRKQYNKLKYLFRREKELNDKAKNESVDASNMDDPYISDNAGDEPYSPSDFPILNGNDQCESLLPSSELLKANDNEESTSVPISSSYVVSAVECIDEPYSPTCSPLIPTRTSSPLCNRIDKPRLLSQISDQNPVLISTKSNFDSNLVDITEKNDNLEFSEFSPHDVYSSFLYNDGKLSDILESIIKTNSSKFSSSTHNSLASVRVGLVEASTFVTHKYLPQNLLSISRDTSDVVGKAAISPDTQIAHSVNMPHDEIRILDAHSTSSSDERLNDHKPNKCSEHRTESYHSDCEISEVKTDIPVRNFSSVNSADYVNEEIPSNLSSIGLSLPPSKLLPSSHPLLPQSSTADESVSDRRNTFSTLINDFFLNWKDPGGENYSGDNILSDFFSSSCSSESDSDDGNFKVVYSNISSKSCSTPIQGDQLYQKKSAGESLISRVNNVPLVGLQYVLEVQLEDNPSVERCNYICSLCSKKMSSTTLVAHIKSVPHRLKFTERFSSNLHERFGKLEVKQWTAALVKEFTSALQEVEKGFGPEKMAVTDEKSVTFALNFLKEKILIDSTKNSMNGTSNQTKNEGLKASEEEKSEKIAVPRSGAPSRALPPKGIPSTRSQSPRSNSRKRSPPTSLSKGIHSFRRSPPSNRRSSPPNRRSPFSNRRSSPPSTRRSPLPPRRSSPYSKRSFDGGGVNRPGAISNDRGNRDVGRPAPHSVSRRRIPSPVNSAKRRSRTPPRGGFSNAASNKRHRSRSPRGSHSRKEGDLERFRADERHLRSNSLRMLDEYTTDPERHPRYKAEWEKFWDRRYREIKQKGINTNTYDFKSDWVKYFPDFIREECNEQFRIKRNELLAKYNIQNDPDPRSKLLIDGSKFESSSRREATAGSSRNKFSTDINKSKSSSSSFSKNEYGRRDRSPSPWEKVSSRGSFQKKRHEVEFSVISTLQQLSELDDQLGSLSSAISDILSKAQGLFAERLKPINVFEDNDNIVALKLARTKLESLISSGILNPMASAKTQKAIECTVWLIKETEGLFNKSTANSYESLGVDIDHISAATIGKNSAEIAQYVAQYMCMIGKGVASDSILRNILTSVANNHNRLKNGHLHGSGNSSLPHGQALFPSGNAEQVSEEKPVSTGALTLLQDAYDEGTDISISKKKMDDLSLDELQNLLMNFRKLNSEQQVELTDYLKKLEATDNKKVTKLRAMMRSAKPGVSQTTMAVKESNTSPVVSNRKEKLYATENSQLFNFDSNRRRDFNGSHINNSNYDNNYESGDYVDEFGESQPQQSWAEKKPEANFANKGSSLLNPNYDANREWNSNNQVFSGLDRGAERSYSGFGEHFHANDSSHHSDYSNERKGLLPKPNSSQFQTQSNEMEDGWNSSSRFTQQYGHNEFKQDRSRISEPMESSNFSSNFNQFTSDSYGNNDNFGEDYNNQFSNNDDNFPNDDINMRYDDDSGYSSRPCLLPNPHDQGKFQSSYSDDRNSYQGNEQRHFQNEEQLSDGGRYNNMPKKPIREEMSFMDKDYTISGDFRRGGNFGSNVRGNNDYPSNNRRDSFNNERFSENFFDSSSNSLFMRNSNLSMDRDNFGSKDKVFGYDGSSSSRGSDSSVRGRGIRGGNKSSFSSDGSFGLSQQSHHDDSSIGRREISFRGEGGSSRGPSWSSQGSLDVSSRGGLTSASSLGDPDVSSRGGPGGLSRGGNRGVIKGDRGHSCGGPGRPIRGGGDSQSGPAGGRRGPSGPFNGPGGLRGSLYRGVSGQLRGGSGSRGSQKNCYRGRGW